MGLPTINIEFKQLAATANKRAERGILAVIVADSTSEFETKEYASAAEIDSDDYTAANYKSLVKAFDSGVYKLIVIRLNDNATGTQFTAAVSKVSYNWICTTSATQQSTVSTAVKALNATGKRARKAKALVCGVSGANDIHVVNVANTTVTLKGEDSTTSMAAYLPRIAGMLAACPLTESVTYKQFDDLEAIAEVADVDTSINGGNLCLFWDDDIIRIARGVNTLTTLGTNQTVDMKKITVVEGMDIMQEDIIKTFKASYLGRVKNNADNQGLFVAEILEYFKELAAESIIDNADDTFSVDIDVTSMRSAWEADGVSVTDLTDAQVKKKTYHASVFVAAKCRILDAMEDLHMTVQMG